jgi:hypothetical protein
MLHRTLNIAAAAAGAAGAGVLAYYHLGEREDRQALYGTPDASAPANVRLSWPV